MINSRLTAAVVWRDFRTDMSYRLPWAMDVIGLISILAVYYYIVRFTHAHAPGSPVNFFTYVVPGLALVRFQFGLARSIASMDREQSSGTLELLLSSPARAWIVVGAASLYELFRSAVLALLALIIGRWVFGAELTMGPRSWAALTMGLIGAIVFFLALTMVTAAVLIAFKRGLPFAGVLAAVIPVVSGVYFSPHVLPSALRTITNAFPLTLAVEVLRAGVVQATFPVGRVLEMLGATFVCMPLGAIAVTAAVHRAKRLGSLGQY